jgi:hypothetical protein
MNKKSLKRRKLFLFRLESHLYLSVFAWLRFLHFLLQKSLRLSSRIFMSWYIALLYGNRCHLLLSFTCCSNVIQHPIGIILVLADLIHGLLVLEKID